MIRQWLKDHKLAVALSVLAASGTILAAIGLMSSSAYLISWAARRPPILDLILVIVAVRFFALSRAALRYLERMVSHDLTFRWLATLRVTLYTILAPRLPDMLLRTRSGDLLDRMVGEVESLQSTYLRFVAPVLTAVIVIFMTVVALLFFSPLLAGVTLFFLLLNGLAIPLWIHNRTRDLGQRQLQSRSATSSSLIEDLQGMQDIWMLGRENIVRDRMQDHAAAMARHQAAWAKWTAWQDGLSLLCAHGAMWTVLAIAIPIINAGHIDGIFLALLTLGVLTSFEAVQPLATSLSYRDQYRYSANRIATIESSPLPITDRATPPETIDATLPIRFQHVSFAYDKENVLSNIDFEWADNRRCGIVGSSGAGKSTLAHLLLRFRDPTSGAIHFGDHDYRSIPHPVLMRHFAVIPQHAHLFSNTIRENLKLANSSLDDDAIWHVLEQTGLAGFVRNLPNGLDTWIGEQGAHCSGGERQRLAIARAILKDAPFFILDEPTAHLDARTEREIIDLLLRITVNKRTLWITHRLLRLDQLDNILVLSRGQILERGSHHELIATSGEYARMLKLQNDVFDG